MEMSFFVRGLLIGLSFAATIGPMSILCIQRTLRNGYFYGLVSGLGVATADATYGSIAGFGLTVISNFLLSKQGWIRVIGGLILIYLGIKTICIKPTERTIVAQVNDVLGAYASAFFLNLTNPLTILWFTAVFASIGLGEASRSYLSATLVVFGVFVGSAVGLCFLISSINLIRGKFTPQWLLWIHRISGGVIALFGALALLNLKW